MDHIIRQWRRLPVWLLLASCAGLLLLRRDSTIYAPGYSEGKYKAVRVGMSKDAVLKVLGPPLSVDAAPGYIQWTYTDHGDGIRQLPGGPAIPPALTFVQADLDGKIISINGNFLEIKNDEFVNHQLVELRAKFGPPHEIRSAPERDLYWYSKMDGVKGHFVRYIDISKEGTVTDVHDGRIGYYVGSEDRQNLSWIEWLECCL